MTRPAGLRSALGLLTVVGGAAPPTAAAVGWFPVVGAAIGAVVGLVWWGASALWPPLIVAALVIAVDAVATGALHLDGTADSADGLLPHLSRERRLEVMSTPDVGAFGVAALTLTVILSVMAIASMSGDVGPDEVGLLAGIWCLSRTAMAVGVRALPPARPGGMASSFGGRSPMVVGIAGGVAAAALAGGASGWRGLTSVVVAAVAAAAVLALARRRLGGVTGDVLGAAGTAAQTIGVVVAAARW